jgi:DNA-binding IclR family transcriptional regulator
VELRFHKLEQARAIDSCEDDVGAPAGSQAVDRAAALLMAVVDSPDARSFTSLVTELGLARSTTSRLLAALERNRLIQRDASGGYRPGALFAAYAARQAGEADLVELARPALHRLGATTGETINLAVPRGDAVVQIAQVDSRYLLGATNWVGVDVPPHCTASGKVFYAFDAMPLPSPTEDAPGLERRTKTSAATIADLERSLSAVRRQGWAQAWEELEPGLVAVAAPVRIGRGQVVAAISISGATARISHADVERFARMLVAESESVSALLRGRGRVGAAGKGSRDGGRDTEGAA